jgi:xeroderma pigmentosum group C-complementing protein
MKQAKNELFPVNWPPGIPYLTTPTYSPALTKTHLATLRTRPTDEIEDLPADFVAGPSAHIRIQPITDVCHPACGQCGLFATRDLRPGEMIVVYIGEIHPGSPVAANNDSDDLRTDTGQASTDTSHDHSDYDLWLDRDGDLAIDAAQAGNEARFINDYRGVPSDDGLGRKWQRPKKVGDWNQTRPDAEFRFVWDTCRHERAMAVFVLPAGKRAVGRAKMVGIEKGKEILVSYGKGFWGERKAEYVDEWSAWGQQDEDDGKG